MSKFEVVARKPIKVVVGEFDKFANARLFAEAYENHYSAQVEIVEYERKDKERVNEMKRSGNFISDIAKALFDGGWGCCDIKDLIDEYGFSFEQAYEICSELELLEREEDND